MPRQSRTHGSASVTVLPVRTPQSTIGSSATSSVDMSQMKMDSSSAIFKTELSPTEGINYGTKKWDIAGIKASNPEEDRILMQAISFTGRRDITVEQAKMIWNHFDMLTRQPK